MNKNIIVNAICGVAGTVVGGVCGYFVAHKKAEKERARDLQETREYYKQKYGSGRYKVNIPEGVANEKPEEEPEPEVAEEEESMAYVIRPQDFDELEEYKAICLNLYSDGYLVTSAGEILDESAESLIGKENMRKFGTYETDTLHLRNDATKTDYEIIMQDEKYIE